MSLNYYICYRESVLSMIAGYDGKVIKILPKNLANKWLLNKRSTILWGFSIWKIDDFVKYYQSK